jgi:hypothetical protein
MELDDVRTAWSALDSRVGAMEALLEREELRRRTRTLRLPLAFMGAGQALQFAIWILVVAVAAPFWIAHRSVPHLLAAGLVLHVYGLAVIISSIVQVLLVVRTWHTTPVLVFQKRIAELRRFRALNSLAFGLPWWILWVPATMVAAKLLGGADLYAASSAWAWGSMAIGLAGMAMNLWFLRHRLTGAPDDTDCAALEEGRPDRAD